MPSEKNMAANYDNSAWFYDRLSRLVYGKALLRSQVYLLKHIPKNSAILIAGGGTGWILEEIANVRPRGLTITYVEISSKMMALSKKRNAGSNEVSFLNEPVEHLSHDGLYELVFTPFLFDNFTEQTLERVFTHIDERLKPGGIWLNTDFRPAGKWWHTLLLRSMFLFFRLICGIEAKKLPGIERQFERHQYQAIDQRSFFGEFILSTAYRKPS